jgi:hypothetical protein
MGTSGHGRRWYLVLGLSILVAVGAGVIGAIALASSGSGGGDPAASPRVTLSAPREAAAGSRVVARGVAAGAADGARVRLEARQIGWRPLGQGSVRKGHYSIPFSMPAGTGLELRAVLYRGHRAVAISAFRRVRVPVAGSGAGAAAGAPPSTATAQPSTAGASPPAETLAGEPPATEAPSEPTDAYWGAWIGGQFTGNEAPWDMNAVTDFETETGKAPSVVEFGSAFADCSEGPCAPLPFPTTPFEAIRRRGAIPFLSWSSQALPPEASEPEYRLATVAAGKYDAYVREFAEAAAAWGHPFFLRFDWEMNGNWFPWGAGVDGNTAADYVAAWRHVHRIFSEAGATNATWVWCPYVDPNSTLATLPDLYPGDEYVDWTCLDGYNWGPSATPARKWRSFASLFGPTYRQVTRTIAPSKPMFVAETASSEHGGSKAEWISEAFASLESEFPRIQGLIWFDKYDSGMDWPLETSPEAEAAFAAGIGDSRYLPGDFGGLETSPIPAP